MLFPGQHTCMLSDFIGEHTYTPTNLGSNIHTENSYLHLDLLGNHAQKHIHIRVPGKFIPPKNKICYININKKKFFIFNNKQ